MMKKQQSSIIIKLNSRNADKSQEKNKNKNPLPICNRLAIQLIINSRYYSTLTISS